MRSIVFVVLASCACGPQPPAGTGTSTGGTGTEADSPTSGIDPTTGGPLVSTGVTGTTSGSTSTGGPVTSTGCDDACGETTVTPDMGPAPACDVALQDCPPDQKCVPFDLGTACVSLAEDPLPDGATCEIDDLGRDRCMRGSFCPAAGFDLEAAVCTALCGEARDCPDDSQCMPIEFQGFTLPYALCLRPCDPLAPTCAAGEECRPPQWFLLDAHSARFACITAAGDGAACDGCSSQAGCAQGLACRSDACCGICDGNSQCAPYCDLDLQDCPNMQLCKPWSSEPQPGLEHVGYCDA